MDSASIQKAISHEQLSNAQVVVIGWIASAADGCEPGGGYMNIHRDNLAQIFSSMEQGRGVLVMPDLIQNGGIGKTTALVAWNKAMRPFDISLGLGCVRDPERKSYTWPCYQHENSFCWTESFTGHPATRGLKRVYYPSANARWDMLFTTPPLTLGVEWTPLVHGMPGSGSYLCLQDNWTRLDAATQPPVLAAVRTVGKGRMAVLAISPTYTFLDGNKAFPVNWRGEMSVGNIDGRILDKGDDVVPSDTGLLLEKLYCWLGEGVVAGEATPMHASRAPQALG